MTTLAAALLLAALRAAPPSHVHALHGWTETTDERTARYASIAADIAAVAEDPAERPIGGDRIRTAALLLAVAVVESGLAPDVDRGPCYRGDKDHAKRCDSGWAACIEQVNFYGRGKTRETAHTVEGWTQADLFGDRRKCMRAALHIMQESARRCGKMGREHVLDGYAGGSTCAKGTVKGRERVRLSETMIAWMRAMPAEPAK